MELLFYYTAMLMLDLPLEVNDLGSLSRADCGEAILDALS